MKIVDNFFPKPAKGIVQKKKGSRTLDEPEEEIVVNLSGKPFKKGKIKINEE